MHTSSRRIPLLCSLAVIVFASAMILVRSLNHICVADELRYFYFFDDHADKTYFRYGTFKATENLADITESMTNHYFCVNGRIPIHFVEQTVATYGMFEVYYAVNALIFALTLVLFVRYCMPRGRSVNPLAVLSATLAFLYLFPVPASLWPSPNLSINYLWPSCATIAILLIFRRLYNDGKKPSLALTILFALLGFLTGWSNEAFSFPLCGASALFFAFRLKSFSAPLRALFIPMWIGAIIMFCSPGNWVRAGAAANHIDSFTTVLFEMKVLWLLLLTAIPAFVFRSRASLTFIRENTIVVTALIIALAMGVIAHTGARSFTAIELFSAILLFRALAPVFYPMNRTRYIVFTLLFAAMVTHQSLITAEHIRQYHSIRDAADSFAGSPTGMVVYKYKAPAPWLAPFVFTMKPCDKEDYYDWRFLGFHLSGSTARTLRALTPAEYERRQKALRQQEAAEQQ